MQFIRNILSSQRASSVSLPALAPERPLCVIGDVHGRVDLLEALGNKLERDWQLSQRDYCIVFVGDYIDRGDDSRTVLEWIFTAQAQPGGPVTLLGNHEEMMLDFLDMPQKAGRRWLRNGGLQTLASFGIGGVTETSHDEPLEEAARALREALPKGMEAWLRQLPRQWSSGNVHVVHAAADPMVPMDAQDDDVLTWGSDRFAALPRSDDQWVVYGHTITTTPGDDGQGRIAIDTGAYYSGCLTAALIAPDGTLDLVQT